MRDTDRDWQRIGKVEPHWGVVTMDKYKSQNMDDINRAEFFASGEDDIHKFMSTLKRYFGNQFRPINALDFGCGVGRLAIAMANKIDRVVGIDVSPGMLRIADNSAKDRQLSNIRFLEKIPEDKFDWINSFIVFQHIPPERGLELIKELLTRLDEHGFISIHVTVYHEMYEGANPDEVDVDDGGYSIRMFNYDINQVIKLFYDAGIIDLNMEMVNHDGHIGIIFYGRKSMYLESRENFTDLDRAPFRQLMGAIARKVRRRISRMAS